MSAAKQQPRWIDYMPLSDVLRAPRNPKRHDHEMLAKSISHYGVVESPTLDERTGRLVAGHGRLGDWERRHTAGEDPPDGIQVNADGDWLVPVSRGWASRSDADADAYLVMSNQSTIAGGWDDPMLLEHLRAIAEADAGLVGMTGFDEDAIRDLEKLHEAPDLDDLAADLGDGPADDLWPILRFKVPHHVEKAWRDAVAQHGSEFQALAALLDLDPHHAPAPPDWQP